MNVSKKLLSKQTGEITYTPWSLDNLRFIGKNLPVYDDNAIGQIGGMFAKDKNTMYALTINGTITEYNMSTALDIRTMSTGGTFSISSTYASAGLCFSSDGLKVFTESAGVIYMHTLSVAWDVTTMTVNQASFDATSYSTDIDAIFMKPDGTKMYLADDTTNTVLEFNLSTAWDITSSTYSTVSRTLRNNPVGLDFSSDGTIMYYCTLSSVYKESLSIAWDVSSGSYDSVKYVKFSDASYGLCVFDDNHIFMGLSSTRAIAYTTFSGIYDTFDNTTGYASVYASNTGSIIETAPYGILWGDNGNYLYIIGTTRDKPIRFTASTPYDVRCVRAGVYSTCNQSFSTSVKDMSFSSDGLNLYVVDYNSDLIYWMQLSTAWDITTCSTPVTLAGRPYMNGVEISHDGTRLYVADSVTDMVQYNLSTPYDLSTAVESKSMDNGIAARSIRMGEDDSVLFLLSYNDIYKYIMSTAGELDTAVLDSSTFINRPRSGVGEGFCFNNEGTKMYMVDTSDAITEFDLR